VSGELLYEKDLSNLHLSTTANYSCAKIPENYSSAFSTKIPDANYPCAKIPAVYPGSTISNAIYPVTKIPLENYCGANLPVVYYPEEKLYSTNYPFLPIANLPTSSLWSRYLRCYSSLLPGVNYDRSNTYKL